MTDFRVAAYECYLSAWAAVSDAQRLSLLREGVTQGVIFSNSTRTRTGIADVVDHLDGFQRGSPGGSFRLLSMLGWDDNALAKWQFVGAGGIAGFKGYDTLAFDKDGMINSIVMFVAVEKQMLK